jgi:RNA polymerase sigma-70 factor (family 1)
MPDFSKHTDQELVVHLQSGNERAFTEIFNRYRGPLFQFIYKKTGDEEIARDIVQDVFIRIWDKRREINLTGSLSSYLYRAVFNRSLDLLKHYAVREEYIVSFQQMLQAVQGGTDHRIREHDMERVIELELAALPARMREVIQLRRKEYLSNREIAERLDLSEQTVETHMKRALRVLKTRLMPVLIFLYTGF